MSKSRAAKRNQAQLNNHLITAIKNSNAGAINKWFQAGGNILAPDKDGCTGMFYAVQVSDEVLQHLTHYLGVGVSTPVDIHGNNILHAACESDLFAIVRYGLEEKMDVNKVNHEGNTPLHIAVSEQSKECCKLLLARATIDLWATNTEGHSAFDLAIKMEAEEFIDMFIAKLVTDPNRRYGEYNETALHEILVGPEESDNAKALRVKAVKQLIEAKADCGLVDATGIAPIHVVATGSNVELAKLLVGQGVNYTLKNQANETPYEVAMQDEASHSIADYLKGLTQSIGVLSTSDFNSAATSTAAIQGTLKQLGSAVPPSISMSLTTGAVDQIIAKSSPTSVVEHKTPSVSGAQSSKKLQREIAELVGKLPKLQQKEWLTFMSNQLRSTSITSATSSQVESSAINKPKT